MAVTFSLVSEFTSSWSVLRICMLLMIFTHHTLICLSSELSEESDQSAPTVEPPSSPLVNNTPSIHAAVCSSDFLEYLTYPNMSGEGEAPVATEIDVDKPEEEDDVLSFAEFKEKMSTLGAETQEIRPSSGKLVTRNYASIECGAKVIDTNSGARNPSAILNSNQDQYLINDCSSTIYFIVELCELISVRSIVIASLEIFSSIPKSFKVFVAERYEAEAEVDDWTYIGTFLAANERSEQSFPLNNEEHVYAKYIKVMMDSHYGQERHCPINTFKVIGASMIEVYEEFQQEVGVASQPSVIPVPDSEGIGEEDSLLDAPGDTEATPYNGTLLSAAKDAVLRMLEQPLEILGTVIKPDGKSSNGDHGNQGEETSTDPAQKEADSAPEEAAKEETSETTEKVEGHDVSNDKLDRSENGMKLISLDTTPDTETNKEESPLSNSTAEQGSQEESPMEVAVESDEVKGLTEPILSVVDTPTTVEEVVKKDSTIPPTPSETSSTVPPPIDEEPVVNGNQTAPPSDDELLGPTMATVLGEPPKETEPLGPTEVGESPTQEGNPPDDTDLLGPTAAPELEETSDLEPEPPLPPPTTVESPLTSPELNSRSRADRIDPTPVPSHASLGTAGNKSATHDSSADSLSVSSSNGTHSPLPTNNGSASPAPTPLTTSLNTSLNTTNGNGGSKGGKNESETIVTNGNGVHSVPRDKEKSVFLRLSNQIKDLEMNMTLFSSYLDQISTGLKRNKNKTEETTKTLDRRLSLLNDTLQLLKNETELKVKVLQGLSSELHTLTEAVVNITMETAAVDDKILVLLLLLTGLHFLILTPCLVICCLLQSQRHHQVQKNLQSLQATIKVLSELSVDTSNGGMGQFRQLRHHHGNSDLGVTCSLPQGEGLTPPTGSDDMDWRVAEGRQRKKNKLKTKQTF